MSRRLAVAAAALLAALAATGAGTARADDGGALPSDPATAAVLADAPAPAASGASMQLVLPSSQLASPDATLPPTWCWATAFWHQWGTWPYQQRITDTTYWCAVLGNRITYRSSSVTGTGTLCATGWTASQLISGGIGYPWFTMRSSAGFSCPTVIPWITLHENRYVDVNRTDTGGTSEVGSG